MPKLNRCFYLPRLHAYQTAINALSREFDKPSLKYEDHVEIRFLLKKLKREKRRFAEKFGLSDD